VRASLRVAVACGVLAGTLLTSPPAAAAPAARVDPAGTVAAPADCDCAGFKLKAASGVPDGGAHRYRFEGACALMQTPPSTATGGDRPRLRLWGGRKRGPPPMAEPGEGPSATAAPGLPRGRPSGRVRYCVSGTVTVTFCVVVLPLASLAVMVMV
jgi:hypothetical protein